MIHLYWGDAKGKTTAAMGLALRMAGRDGGVVIAQFLKHEGSGERIALAALPQITLLPLPTQVKFTNQLSPQELVVEQGRNHQLLEQALALAQSPHCHLLVLDEICDAVELGLVSLDALLQGLDGLTVEIVLTGHTLLPQLEARCDYITHFRCLRHPYEKGISARRGIEF